jgi:hypothetical protein
MTHDPLSHGAKEDEQSLWSLFPEPYQYPRGAAEAIGMTPRRLLYLCEKWARQRRYEYGCVADMGWKV